MSMPIDKDAIEKRLKKATKKVYSVRIDEALMESIKDWCDQKGHSYSALTEELYREFLASNQKKK